MQCVSVPVAPRGKAKAKAGARRSSDTLKTNASADIRSPLSLGRPASRGGIGAPSRGALYARPQGVTENATGDATQSSSSTARPVTAPAEHNNGRPRPHLQLTSAMLRPGAGRLAKAAPAVEQNSMTADTATARITTDIITSRTETRTFQSRASQLLASAASNIDGSVSNISAAGAKKKKEWMELFSMVDIDNGGSISTEEFSKAMKDCQRYVDPESKLGLEMANWDLNHDGSLSEDEFIAFCEVLHSALGDEGFNVFKDEVVANAWEARCCKVSLLHTIIHPEHNGFELGGRAGNVVTKVYGSRDGRVILDTADACKPRILMERGWKAVAIDYKFVRPEEITVSFLAARREGRKCTVTFEVTEEVASRLGSKAIQKNGARMQLEAMLGNRSLEELDELSEEAKDELLKKFRVQCLMVDSMAVMQLDVLLGVKTAKELRLGCDVRDALKKGDGGMLEGLIGDVSEETAVSALMSRDAGGNVAMHYCEGVDSLKTLLDFTPDARTVKNTMMQTPIHTFFARGGAATKEVEALELLLASQDPALLLEPDEAGVSPAMMMEGAVRRKVEENFALWCDMEVALGQDEMCSIIPQLEELRPKGAWKWLLSYYCFGEMEVWREGRHTKTSQARLAVVWETLHTAMHLLFARDVGALGVARALMEATKGPKHIDLDTREPYREELLVMVQRLEGLSGGELEVLYTDLLMEGGETADWLLTQKDKVDDQHGAWEKLGLDPRSRVRLPAPTWVHHPNLKVVYQDLQNVGMVGAMHANDASYELLCLGCQESACTVSVEEKDLVISRWYAAWMLGTYRQEHTSLASSMRELLGKGKPPETFMERQQPKDFSRIVSKMVSYLNDIVEAVNSQKKEVTILQRWHLTLLGRQAASLVCDVHACRYVAETAEELRKICGVLESAPDELVGFNNRFKRDAVSVKNPYRNIVACIEKSTPSGPLLMEVEIDLRSMSDELRWMRVALDVHNGYYDWQHMAAKIPDIMAGAVGNARRKLLTAMEKRDLQLLRVAVPKAETVGIEQNLCDEGNALIRELETQLAIDRALNGDDFDALQHALAAARKLGCHIDEDKIARAEALMKERALQKQLQQQLRDAWINQDAMQFASALDASKDTLGLDFHRMEEIVKMFRKRGIQNLLVIAVRDRDINGLEEVLKGACDNGFGSTEVSEAARLVANLRQVLDEVDAESVIMDVERLLLHLDIRSGLQQAAESGDPEMLRQAMIVARNAKFSESDLHYFSMLQRELKQKKEPPSENKGKTQKSMPKALRQKVASNRCMTNQSHDALACLEDDRSSLEPVANESCSEAQCKSSFQAEMDTWTVEDVHLLPDEEARKILKWALESHKSSAH